MPTEMSHVSLVPHEALGTVGTTEWKVSSMTPLVTDQLVAVPKLFLTIFTGVPLSVLVNSCMLCQMLPLSKAFVADVTNERFVGGIGRGLDRSGGHFILDNSRSLTEGVAFRLDSDCCCSGAACHSRDLDRDPVPLRVALPHGVWIVDKQVAAM